MFEILSDFNYYWKVEVDIMIKVLRKLFSIIVVILTSITLFGCEEINDGFPPKEDINKFEVIELENFFTFTDDFCYSVNEGYRLSIYFNFKEDSELNQLLVNINDYLHDKSLFSYCGYPDQIGIRDDVKDAYTSDELYDHVRHGLKNDTDNIHHIYSVNFIYKRVGSESIYHLKVSYKEKKYNDKSYTACLKIEKEKHILLYNYDKNDYYEIYDYCFTKEEFLYFYEEYKKQNDNLLFFGIDNDNYYTEVKYKFTSDKILKEAYDNKIYDQKYENPYLRTNFVYKDNEGNEEYSILFNNYSNKFDNLSDINYTLSEYGYAKLYARCDIYANGVDIGFIQITFKNDVFKAMEDDPNYVNNIVSKFLSCLTY